MNEYKMLTTTDKLALAFSMNLFSTQNNIEIIMYLASRSSIKYPDRYKIYYTMLLEESISNGYTDVIRYCEDIRYKRMIEIYKEKIKIREQLVENKRSRIESKEYNINTNNIKLIDYFCSLSKDRCTDSLSFDIAPLSFVGGRESTPSLFNIQPNILFNGIIKQKQSRKFYMKMTAEEKELDDYMDTIDEHNYFVRKNSNGTTDFQKLVRKIKSTKRSIKDKSMWKTDFEIIKKEILKRDNIIESVKEKVNMIEVGVCMVTVVLEMMLALQEGVFMERKGSMAKREDMCYMKKIISVLYDLYRK